MKFYFSSRNWFSFSPRFIRFVGLSILLLIGSCFYFTNLDSPRATIWDETYYVASASSYNQRIYFMQTHPPLAKLLMALGEEWLHMNSTVDFDEINKSAYLTETPLNLELLPYRIFPALTSWLCLIPIYFIALLILESPLWATVLSGFFLFENAYVLNGRAALLDGPQNFFFLLALWLFTHEISRAKIRPRSFHLFLLASLIALSSLCRTTSLILLPLPIYYIYLVRPNWKICLRWFFSYTLGFVATVFVIYAIHIQLGQKTTGDRWYTNEPALKTMIESGESRKLRHLAELTWKNIVYQMRDGAAVPPRNKFSEQENGSHPLGWILGIRTIEYRWERVAPGLSRYLIFLFNPIGLLFGVAALTLGVSLIVGRFIYGFPTHDKIIFERILLYCLLYAGYMCTLMSFHRVLYIHNYLLPHLLVLILGFYLFKYLFWEEVRKKDRWLLTATGLFLAQMIICFWFFSPFTFNETINMQDYSRRNWLEFWQIANPK